jgi:isoleucyl-tRNA synthetase
MLADLLIVSQVETSLSQDDPMGGQTLSFRVLPAAGQKCERCWKVLPTVGSDAKHPTLCPRCASVIAKSTSFEAL